MKNLVVLPAVVLALVFAVNCQEDSSTPLGADTESTAPRFHHNPGHGGGGGPGGGGGDKGEVRADVSTTGAFIVTGTNQPVERDNKNNFWFGRAIVNGTTNFAASKASPACTLDDPSSGGSDGGGNVAGRLQDALVDAVGKDRAMSFRVFKNILGEPGHGVSVNSDTGKVDEDLGTVAVIVRGTTVSANVPANQCCIPSVLTFTGGDIHAVTRWDEDGDGVLEPSEPIAALDCPHLDTLVATMSEPTP